MKMIYDEKPELNVIICTDENGIVCSIPMNEANADYQAYLKRDEQQAEANQMKPIADEA